MEKYNSGWVIGSAGGIGNSAIKPLLEICNNICLFDKKETIIPTEIVLGTKVRCWKTDFSVQQETEIAIEDAAILFGPPQILLIAAGEVISKRFELTSNSEIATLFQNNYLLVFDALKYFFKYCSKANDIEKSIAVVSSNAGGEARPNQIVYASFKSAINSLVKSLAKDWGKYNIRINIIAPGTVIVPRNIESLKEKFPDFPNDLNRPISKLPYPQDLASTFTYLFSRDNPITGQIITVDGGSSL